MTHPSLSRPYGPIAGISSLLAIAVYSQMITTTLPRLEAVSGLIPFDMRPLGYSVDEAMQLLDALGAPGRSYYLTHQLPLDMAYPALLAVTLVSMLCWLGMRVQRPVLLRFGIIISVLAAGLDYAENLGIIGMILHWPDVPVGLIWLSSAASISKAMSTSVAVLICVALAVNWGMNALLSNGAAHYKSSSTTPSGSAARD